MEFNRTLKPDTRTELKFTLPQVQTFNLDNGLKVYFVHRNNLPMIRMNLMIDAGSKYDKVDKNGLAYLTTLCLDEGAGGLGALELSDKFDLLGSNFNLSADNDSVNISLQSLSENFEQSLELFSMVLLKPDFSLPEFEREKSKLVTRILQSKDEPEYLADQVFDYRIFSSKNGYYSPVSGYEDTVSSLILSDLKEFYTRHFVPSGSNLVVAGNIEKDDLIILLNKYLKNWKDSNCLNSFENIYPIQQKRIFVLDKKDSVQTEIRAGHISPKRNQDDYFRRMILNTILGGQFTSRINLNLRERNGYTYGATSRFQYYKDAGFFEVATSVGIENTGNALTEILFELQNIYNGITDKELDFAKSSVTKKFPLNFETYRQIVSGISSKILFDLPDNYFDTYISMVNSVTKNEVEMAAKEFILNDELTIVLVGDKKQIIEKITKLNIGFSEIDFKGNLI